MDSFIHPAQPSGVRLSVTHGVEDCEDRTLTVAIAVATQLHRFITFGIRDERSGPRGFELTVPAALPAIEPWEEITRAVNYDQLGIMIDPGQGTFGHTCSGHEPNRIHQGRAPVVNYHADIGDRISLGAHVLSDGEVVSLACGLRGSTVSVTRGLASFEWNGRHHQQSSIELRVDCPEKLVQPTVRHILKGRVAGVSRLVIYNQYFCLLPEHQGGGTATKALGRQIAVVLAANIASVLLYAAGSYGSKYSGYLVWPKLGYDGIIPNQIWDRIPRGQLIELGLNPDQPITIRDLYAGGGENLWKLAGAGYDMSFGADAGRPPVARLFNRLRGTL